MKMMPSNRRQLLPCAKRIEGYGFHPYNLTHEGICKETINCHQKLTMRPAGVSSLVVAVSTVSL